MATQTDALTLEHKVLGPGNFANNVAELKRWDSLAQMQAIRAGTQLEGVEIPEGRPEEMQRLWFYASDAIAYSIRDGKHVFELYDLNNGTNFPNKSEFVRTVRKDGYQLSKLQDLEDKARVINLSDEQFNKFVTRDNNDYSHITFQISDVIKGKAHFEETYGTEATKLFTTAHGEDVYSENGIKGRFREGQKIARIYFQNQSVTEARLKGQEEGTKVLCGAGLGRLDVGSGVDLDYRFYGDGAHVSGVVEKSGVAGTAQKEEQKPQYTPQGILCYLQNNPVRDKEFAAGLLAAANQSYQSQK